MSLHQDLIAAKALIADPSRWCKRKMEEDGSFCAMGAAAKIGGGYSIDSDRTKAMYLVLSRLTPGWQVSVYNDTPTTTHGDIMALYDRAIEATK